MTELGCAGYAADGWLEENHHLTMGMAEARHVLALVLPGVTPHQVSKLVRALTDLSDHVRGDPDLLPRADAIPRIGAVAFDRALPPADAFFAETEEVGYEECAGRIAAEIIAPAPPGIPRVMPGQRIGAPQRDRLVASCNAGVFVLDPADPSQNRIRVVRGETGPAEPFMLTTEAGG